MKRILSVIILSVMFVGCTTQEVKELGPGDIPTFLLDKGGSNVKTTKGKARDKLLEVLDGDTLEFDDRTLNLFQIKAPELHTESVKKSQAAQCTEADVSVIDAMARLSREYIQNNVNINGYCNLDLRSIRDRYRIQIGLVYKKRDDGNIQTLGLSAVKNGYAVPSNYQSDYYTTDAKYQIAAQKEMVYAMQNNKGLWKDYPAEMNCLAEMNHH